MHSQVKKVEEEVTLSKKVNKALKIMFSNESIQKGKSKLKYYNFKQIDPKLFMYQTLDRS